PQDTAAPGRGPGAATPGPESFCTATLGARARERARALRDRRAPMTAIPRTMQAVRLMGHGGLDQLVHTREAPTPQPAPGEVLLDVHACGMNNTDIWVREGAYGSETD